MKEEIEKVLSDETFTTNEERVEAITKSLATLVIPKDKFNDVNTKLKAVENDYLTLNTEFDEFKKSTMTDEQRRETERLEMETKVRDLSVKESEYAVRDLFTNANISKDKYEKVLGKVVSENKERSLEIAQTFVDMLSETIDETKKKTTTDLLNSTPKPITGNPNGKQISNLDAYKTKYDEAVKNNNLPEQVAYLRLIQEEQAKQNLK